MTQKRHRRSGVEDRWRCSDGSPSVADGRGLRWRARYVDDDGREHAKGFRTKASATQWLNGVVATQETGNYIDPRLGKSPSTATTRNGRSCRRGSRARSKR
jgi:hypothetical protein